MKEEENFDINLFYEPYNEIKSFNYENEFENDISSETVNLCRIIF